MICIYIYISTNIIVHSVVWLLVSIPKSSGSSTASFASINFPCILSHILPPLKAPSVQFLTRTHFLWVNRNPKFVVENSSVSYYRKKVVSHLYSALMLSVFSYLYTWTIPRMFGMCWPTFHDKLPIHTLLWFKQKIICGEAINKYRSHTANLRWYHALLKSGFCQYSR